MHAEAAEVMYPQPREAYVGKYPATTTFLSWFLSCSCGGVSTFVRGTVGESGEFSGIDSRVCKTLPGERIPLVRIGEDDDSLESRPLVGVRRLTVLMNSCLSWVAKSCSRATNKEDMT